MSTTPISNNIKIDDQEVQGPSIKIFANQINCTRWEKISIFALKSAISGPHLTFLCNNYVLGPQLTFISTASIHLMHQL